MVDVGNVARGVARASAGVAGVSTSDVGNLTQPGHLSLIRETVRHVPNNYAN